MKKIWFVIFFLFSMGFTCDAIPDGLILNNDTLELRNFYNRTDRYFKPFSRYRRKLMKQGGSSTACYAYRELWEIKNDSLYLDTLIACSQSLYTFNDESFSKLDSAGVPDSTIYKINTISGISFSSYWELSDELDKHLKKNEYKQHSKEFFISTSRTPANYIPLQYNKLLKKRYRDIKIFAENYSGFLSVEVGNTIDSMRVYWHNISDEELFFQIKNGVVKKVFSVNTFYNGSFSAKKTKALNGYMLPILDDWVETNTTLEETGLNLSFEDTLLSNSITYKSINFESSFFEQLQTFKNVQKVIDGMIIERFPDITFSSPTHSRLLFNGAVKGPWQIPYISAVTGQTDSSHITIAVAFASSAQTAIVIESGTKEQNDELFHKIITNVDCAWIRRDK